METIRKSIDINAPKEKVWDVLLKDEFTRIWYSEFSEGSHAVTDWKVGSKAIFKDHSGNGLIAKVIANEPCKLLSIEHQCMLMNGVEDYESKYAKEVKGAKETYKLSEENGITHVDIECDMGPDMFEMMAGAWDKALQKVKELSEAK